MGTVQRILDANFNRAREALRVMEEAARFLLDDPALTQELKQLRHDLATALRGVPGLVEHRDTPGDVGVNATTDTEAQRGSTADVVVAAAKRLGEALRTMEEYAKTLPQADTVATTVETLRYRGYDLEQRLIRAMGSGQRRQWRLCLLLTESLCRRPWREVLEAAIAGGADCVQVREKDEPAAALLERVREVVAITRPRGVSVIVNDRPDIALLAQADGVHLGQTDLPCRETRRLAGRQLLIGVSTSCIDEARQALADGADYCGVGPMFPTTTKHKDIIVGPAYLREFTAWGKLPHLAIGGVTPDNVTELAQAGAGGVAVSAAICAADDPQAVARRLIAGFTH